MPNERVPDPAVAVPAVGDFGIVEKPVEGAALQRALARAGLLPSTGRTPCILVVDDDPVMVEILAVYLDNVGCAVRRAGGGREALRVVRGGGVDGLVLDLMMPDVDGFAVVEALRGDPATAALPVLVLTGLSLTPDQLYRLTIAAGNVLGKRNLGDPEAPPPPPYRELVESSRDWVWQINDLGVFSYCSPQVERLLGYRPDELDGRSRFDLLVADEALRMARVFAQCAAERRPIDLFESEYRHRDGRRVFLETSAMPFADGAGRYRGYRGIDRDVTERRLAEEALRASERQVSALAAHLERVREEEKTAIAREIHDEFGGTLAAIGVDLHWLADRLAGAAEQARLDGTVALVEGAVRSLRRIVTELRPTILDDLGLFAAIEWQVAEFRRRAGIDCRLGIACDAEPTGQAAAVLFRVVQESLTNVMRHAGARRVDVELWSATGETVLEVADDGIGIGERRLERAGAHGLRGMRERVRHLGGRLDVMPRAGGGTLVRAVLPFAVASGEAA